MKLMQIFCARCGKTSNREAQEIQNERKNEPNEVLFKVPPCPICAETDEALKQMVDHLKTAVFHLEHYNALLRQRPEWGGNGGVQAGGEMQKRMKRSLEWLKSRIQESNFADVLPSHHRQQANGGESMKIKNTNPSVGDPFQQLREKFIDGLEERES